MHACRLIKEHGLFEGGHVAQPVPVVGSIELHTSLLLVKETPFAYRFAFAGPNVRRVGAPWTSGWLQKAHVQEIRWASDLTLRSVFRLDPKKERVATDFRVTLEAAPWVKAVRGAAR